MATGDKLVNLDDLKAVYERIPSGSGLTDEIKDALLQIASKVAYVDEHGQDYYNDLYNALYAITAIRLNTSSLTMNTIGGTSQLTATTTPEGGAVTWTSSNTAVATVSANGLVTAVGLGSATVTATAGSVSAACSVVVAAATVTTISARYTQSGTVYESASLDDLKADLVVTASWSDGTTSTVPGTEYTLSGTLSAGTSTITVSYGGKTTTFNVTVAAAPTLSSISAVYTQSGTVYDTDTLNSLKSDLVVTATYSDSSMAILPAADYTLSGTLTEGTSTITVSYEGKTATFAVTVTSDRERMSYVYSDGDLIKLSAGIATNGGYFGITPNDSYRRRTFVLDHGEQPLTDTTTGEDSEYYPIPIPQSATSVTITITPETQYFGARLLKLSNGAYTTVTDVGWKLHTHTQEFVAGSVDYLTLNCKYNSGGYEYPVEPTELTIEFR